MQQLAVPAVLGGPRVNPLRGWPVSDYVRDAAALLLLFSTLGMPWALNEEESPWAKGADVWWVVIAVLLSVGSLVLPYLAKARVVRGWAPHHYLLVKLALNLPLLGCVLAALIVESLNGGDDDLVGALGSGIAMSLAGVAMTVQPRQAEEEPGQGASHVWSKVSACTILGAAAWGVLSLGLWLVHAVSTDPDPDPFDPLLRLVLVLVSMGVMPLVVVVWPAVRAATGASSAAWRRVFATSGFTVLSVSLLALGSDRDGLFLWPPVEKWFGAGPIPGGGALLVGAGAAFAVSRVHTRTSIGADRVAGHVDTARAALTISAAGAGIYAASVLLSVLADGEVAAASIVIVVLAAVCCAAAAYALSLVSDVRQHRVVILAVSAGIVVLGAITMGVANSEEIGQTSSDSLYLANTGWAAAALMTLPALAACCLTVPREVRAAFGPLIAPSDAGLGPQHPGHPQMHQHDVPTGHLPAASGHPQSLPPHPAAPLPDGRGTVPPPPLRAGSPGRRARILTAVTTTAVS